MSRAVRLRNQALKLAQVDNLNLLSKIAIHSRIASHLADLVQKDGPRDARDPSLLLVGGCTPGLMTELRQYEVFASTNARVLKHHTRSGTESPEASSHAPAPGAGNGATRPHGRVVHGDLSDYALDPDRLEQELARHSLSDSASYFAFRERMAQSKAQSPWLPDNSVDVLVQDLTPNLLGSRPWRDALRESFRVLKRDGVLSVVALASDERFDADPQPLEWGEGGALRRFPREDELLETLDEAGFHGMSLHPLADLPVALVDGRELRAFAVAAYKGKAGVCLDQGHAVVYRGPWREVRDDDDHVYRRGARTAVCAKTYDLLMRAPYRDQFLGLPASDPPALEDAPPFDCSTPSLRDPAVTKGRRPLAAAPPAAAAGCCGDEASTCCEPTDDGGGCC